MKAHLQHNNDNTTAACDKTGNIKGQSLSKKVYWPLLSEEKFRKRMEECPETLCKKCMQKL